MAFLVENAFGGKELVQDANHHPTIRLFTTRKLTAAQPATLADAGSIPGITPNALRYLLAHVQANRRKAAVGAAAEA